MRFSRQEYWSGEPFPSPGDLPNAWIQPKYLALQADSLPSEPQGKPLKDHRLVFLFIEEWEAVKGFEPGKYPVQICTIKRSLQLTVENEVEGKQLLGNVDQVVIDKNDEYWVYFSEPSESKIIGLSAEQDWLTELEGFVKDDPIRPGLLASMGECWCVC